MVETHAGVRIRDGDLATLVSWTRSPSIHAGAALRARIVLACARGEGTSQVARRLGVSRPTVIAWRERYRAAGLEALRDAPRSGRPRTVDEAEIVARTLEPPPAALGVSHWSSRLLAAELGLGDATVARCWRRFGLQPWRRETFKFSTDPELEAKVRDVIGLYLDPPQKAVVLCVEKKSQIQALDRSAPILPLRPGLPEKATHDYVRHGTTTLCRRAVAHVVVGGLLGEAGTQGQDRGAAVQSLDLALLLDAKHDRLLRRVQVEADDVPDLGLELGIGGELEGLPPPRLQPEPSPAAGDRGVPEAELGGEQPARPVAHPQRRRRGLQGASDDLGLVHRPRSPRARRVPQSLEPSGAVALSPSDHRRARDPEASGDLRGALPPGAGEHDAGAQGRPGVDRRRTRPAYERRQITVTNPHPSVSLDHGSSLHLTAIMSIDL